MTTIEEPAQTPFVIGEREYGDLKLTLETRKRTWLLGENMLVHYVVRNEGAGPVKISFGGDYRGAARAQRIEVSVKGPDGTLLDDPYPGGSNFGGLGGEPELAPNEEFAFVVPLHRYARFETAGRHSIRVAHDIGQTPRNEALAEDDGRWVEAEIDVAKPTALQAQEVMRRMQARSSTADRRVGERAQPFADFSAMRHPIYLAPLRELAPTDERAFRALSQIATLDATRALLALAEHDDVEVAKRALEAIAARLPLPPGRQDWPGGTRAYFLEHAWDASALGADVRTLALELLAAVDPDLVMAGAGMLAVVGTPSDLDLVTRGLDAALESTKTHPIPYPEPASTVSELLRTTQALLDAGATPAADPKSPGEVAVHVTHYGPKTKRPPQYATRAAAWLGHPIPQVRVLVLRGTAAPLDSVLAEALPELLESDHLGVQNAACDALAEYGPVKGAKNAVLAAADEATDDWLVRCLARAAPAVGLDRDRVADIWARRLVNADHASLMYEQLSGLLDAGGGGMSGEIDAAEAERLSAAWRRFIARHRTRIRAGRLFTPEDDVVTDDLLPAGANINARDGSAWLARPRPTR